MALQLFKIADVLVESPVATVTFSSIPQGYTDLVLEVSGRSTSGIDQNLEFNGVTTNLSARYLLGSGSSVSSGTTASIIPLASNNQSSFTTNTFGSLRVYIPNYTSSNYKSVSAEGTTENNATESYAIMVAGLWSNTAAITSIKLVPQSSSFAANSTLTLYGVL
jgi:hypothetical protein